MGTSVARREEVSRFGYGNLPVLGGSKAVSAPKWKPPVVIQQRHARSAAHFVYEHPDLDDDPQEDPHVQFDLQLAGHLAEWKERNFPGHPFEFEVNVGQGVVLVSLPALMGPINRYVVHVRDLYSDPKMTRMLEACGNLLERYGIGRAGYSRDDFAAAVSAKPVLFRRHEEVPD